MDSYPLGIVFSDVNGESLQNLTSDRTTAAIPFGGKYRLVDFTLSNMVNSGIRRIGVVVKNNYQSLLEHLNSGREWDLSHNREGLFIFPPYSREYAHVYQSHIEALRGILEFIRQSKNEYVVLSDCNLVANGDFKEPIQYHIQKSADITLVYHKTITEKTSSYSISAIAVDDDGRVNDIRLNPEVTGINNVVLNTWIISKTLLEYIIVESVSRGYSSWERDIIKKGIAQNLSVFGWEFKGYAKQIFTLHDYFSASMDILDLDIRKELFYRYGHVFTRIRDEAPAQYYKNAQASDSSIADGCIIDGNVENSIIFSDVRIGYGSHISNSVIMQGARIGTNVTLNYAIIDKDVYINDNRTMMGYLTHPIYIRKGSRI